MRESDESNNKKREEGRRKKKRLDPTQIGNEDKSRWDHLVSHMEVITSKQSRRDQETNNTVLLAY